MNGSFKLIFQVLCEVHGQHDRDRQFHRPSGCHGLGGRAPAGPESTGRRRNPAGCPAGRSEALDSDATKREPEEAQLIHFFCGEPKTLWKIRKDELWREEFVGFASI